MPPKSPGPDHPITIAANPRRVVVRFAGRTIADSRKTLTLAEATYPPVHYFPRCDVELALLRPSAHTSGCPYKGPASYFSVVGDGRTAENAVWSYEQPNEAVAEIRDYVAFYPTHVDTIDLTS